MLVSVQTGAARASSLRHVSFTDTADTDGLTRVRFVRGCDERERPMIRMFVAWWARPAAACAFAMLLCSPAGAQEGEAPAPPAAPASPLEWIQELPVPIEPAFPIVDPGEICGDKPSGPAWIDRMHVGLYRTMCSTAVWFDGFFGSARFDDEYQATHGRLSVGTLWDERDQWDPSVRFRLQMQLPKLSDRYSVFVGKLDPDEYVTELRDDFDALPRQFGAAGDDAVLLGLGYSQPGRRAGHFDVGVGLTLESPVGPYIKGTYRVAVPMFERNLLRLRETVFWEEPEGFGATTRFDLERLFTDALLARWTVSGTFSQETEGVRCFSSVTLFQNLRNGRALSYQVGINAESEREVPIVDYGLRVIYRRTIFDREWLFLELRSGVTWPRESLEEQREPVLGGGVAVEMMFGENRRR
ncbi:MAG: hypothetical protein H6R27_1303 [Proteobacteria bacterium]|nr:hypothetical protein [Pseudomonadota bacterium]